MEPNTFGSQPNRLWFGPAVFTPGFVAIGASLPDLWNWSDTAVCGGAIFNTRIDITGAPHALSVAAIDRIAAYCALSLIDHDHIRDARDKLIDVLEWQRDVPLPKPAAEVYSLPLGKKVIKTVESAPIDFE